MGQRVDFYVGDVPIWADGERKLIKFPMGLPREWFHEEFANKKSRVRSRWLPWRMWPRCRILTTRTL